MAAPSAKSRGANTFLPLLGCVRTTTLDCKDRWQAVQHKDVEVRPPACVSSWFVARSAQTLQLMCCSLAAVPARMMLQVLCMKCWRGLLSRQSSRIAIRSLQHDMLAIALLA
jgi:hypothetical protein